MVPTVTKTAKKFYGFYAMRSRTSQLRGSQCFDYSPGVAGSPQYPVAGFTVRPAPKTLIDEDKSRPDLQSVVPDVLLFNTAHKYFD